jgi:methylmalonyl-CoA/ethylmalonyl-CoA epimerase
MEGSKSMTAQTRGRIRHVALSVEDPWETAEFYKQAVGLQEVTELDGPLAEGVFLTDGVVNLAILHFKSDEAAQGTGKDFVGIHHIGFWVDDVVEQGKIVRNTGATVRRTPRPGPGEVRSVAGEGARPGRVTR